MPITPAKPRFRGKIYYPSLSIGSETPVINATIKIYDLDVDGNNDLLIETTTSSSGRFNKLSTKKWADPAVIQRFNQNITVPSTVDVPTFVIEIDDPATGHSMTVPFIYLNDNFEIVMPVNWPSPTPDPAAPRPPVLFPPLTQIQTLITINGTRIRSNDKPELVWEQIKGFVEQNKEITITFGNAFGAAPFELPFKYDNGLGHHILDYENLRLIVCNLLNIDINSSVLKVNTPVEILIVIALIIFIILVASPLAFSLAIFLIIVGICILLAVMYGYRVELKQKTTASSGTSTSVPLPLSELDLVLIPPDNP